MTTAKSPEGPPDHSDMPLPPSQGIGLVARLRNYLFAGILVTAPVSITLYLAWLFVNAIDSRVIGLLPPLQNPEHTAKFWIPGLGLLLLIGGLILVGMVAAGFVGRIIGQYGERLLARLPVIRSIYGATKQIFEAVLAKKSTAFREVVLVEFPRRGIWTLGFITGTVDGEVQDLVPQELVSVFIPTTPNPTGGYLMFFPRADVRPISMSVEDGLKLIVSTGIVTPPDRRLAATANGKAE
jgi:uncharacterized membrane protein